MPKVFIPNTSAHDYTDAERYGCLVPLTKGNLDLGNTSRIFREVEESIRKSSPDDYILISGASIVNGIVCGLFACLHGKLNLLVYRRNGKYIERNINMKDLNV